MATYGHRSKPWEGDQQGWIFIPRTATGYGVIGIDLSPPGPATTMARKCGRTDFFLKKTDTFILLGQLLMNMMIIMIMMMMMMMMMIMKMMIMKMMT